LIAARKPDQDIIRDLGSSVSGKLIRVKPQLERLWLALGPVAQTVFGNSETIGQSDLAAVLPKLADFAAADDICKSILVSVPVQLSERHRLLAALEEGRRSLRALAAGDALGQKALAGAWLGAESDWIVLQDAISWIKTNSDIRELASRIPDRAAVANASAVLVRDRDAFVRRTSALFDALKLDRERAIGYAEISSCRIERLEARFDVWLAKVEALSKWIEYRDRANTARLRDLSEFVEALELDSIGSIEALPLFELSTFEALLNDMVRLDPELARFNGFLHNKLVNEFAELDQMRIKQSRLEVARAHHRHIPSLQGGVAGPLKVLRGEIARKRGHMPIRQLMEKAAPAIQALKPVLMVSPLSVAQYLPPGIVEFDLLVMDEASQIQPVDALGAVARCKQVVVVGDPQQLPPTSFFNKMTSSTDDNDEEGAAKVADIESILGLFTARGLPKRMLRWHYRSRHQSLIAVSNSQFYENKLFIIPSPYSSEAGMGLRFHHIAGGLFDTGKTCTNVIEARVVAKAIIDHALTHPEQSLGVVAFSSQQRRSILEQLELLRRNLKPEHDAYFEQHTNEPFFIKNLENVQGDERDVIFISVGYAASTPGGKVPMRFGPLGMAGGDRRLNVLISRAKRRCEVFSSITEEDIDPDFAATRKGIFAFRLFLHFARTGRLSLIETTARDHDGVLEAQVAKVLQDKGYQVHRNVGIAGLFVDLAVADPDQPGRYILGVECDGASYRSARSARDRDRIRRAVLEDHGWSIHRIWSADWFQRPGEELERLVAAVEAAKSQVRSRDAQVRTVSRAVPVDIVAVERETVTEVGLVGLEEGATDSTAPYQEASVKRPSWASEDLHMTPTGVLSNLAEQVVVVIKTIAGFTNQSGGTLLIGVRDDGVVTGIESDYATLSGGNRDKFELHLSHLINSHFGPAFHATRLRLSFPTLTGRTIGRIDVQKSPTGVVIKLPDRGGSTAERFYVRVGNSTQELSPSQMASFIGNRK
jgi:very-short-patch-repair endonuclease